MHEMTKACLGQNAAKTAKQLIVVVVRKDLWNKRAQANINFLKNGKSLPLIIEPVLNS